MLLAGKYDALIKLLLAASAQDKKQGADYSVHVANLIGLQVCEARRNGFVFSITADFLKVGDLTTQFIA